MDNLNRSNKNLNFKEWRSMMLRSQYIFPEIRNSTADPLSDTQGFFGEDEENCEQEKFYVTPRDSAA
ncbi:MAG: hypothetical protein JKY84_07195 [Emcibacteraceae bacterium]|nr:hypothetical protein [Emcibacteraceae bacterium]